MSTFAVVVGLERYDQSETNVSGPAAGAVGIVEWLHTLGVPPKHISLFVTVKDELANARLVEKIGQLAANGMNVTRSGKYELIDTFLRRGLPRAAQDANATGARLLFYWSGHGYVGRSGRRYWLCEDFRLPNLTDRVTMTNRVMDATQLFRLLATYPAFTEQLVLVDTCAVPANVTFDPSPDGEQVIDPSVVQRGILAAPEGYYAEAGEFSRVVTEHLRRSGWPADSRSFLDFVESLRREASQIRRTSYLLLGEHQQQGWVGRSKLSAAGSAALALLESLPLPLDERELHYQQTISSHAGDQFLSARKPIEMIMTLDRMGEREDVASDALIEFMLRLARLGKHGDTFESWVGAHGKPGQVAAVRETLARQEGRRILVVDIGHKAELITSFQCFVRTALDLRPIPEPDRPRRTVLGWNEFVARLGWDEFVASFQQELQDMRQARMLNDDFDIEFLLDAPLFHLPFHQIPIPDGEDELLGNEYVVITRYQRRPTKRDRVEDWHRFALDVRSASPNVPVQRLTQPENQEAIAQMLRGLLEKRGLYYTGFTLSKDARHDTRMKAVLNLLNFGAPYLLWFHEPHSAHEWQKFEAWLADRLDRLHQEDRSFIHFPHAIPPFRRTRDPYAFNITIMWDDPHTHPLLRRRFINPV